MILFFYTPPPHASYLLVMVVYFPLLNFFFGEPDGEQQLIVCEQQKPRGDKGGRRPMGDECVDPRQRDGRINPAGLWLHPPHTHIHTHIPPGGGKALQTSSL